MTSGESSNKEIMMQKSLEGVKVHAFQDLIKEKQECQVIEKKCGAKKEKEW